MQQYFRGAVLLLALGGAVSAQAQVSQAGAPAKAPKDPKPVPALWRSTAPFEMTLTINLSRVKADKMDEAPWRAATIRYADGTTPVEHAARVKTRGGQRLRLCDFFPPLWVDFDKKDTKGHALDKVNRFKLVSPCKQRSDFDAFIIEEYTLYRALALLTPVHHLTRFVTLTVVDSATKRLVFTRPAFIIEDLDELAERLGGAPVKQTGATTVDLDPFQTAVTGLFQLMIANTDFSYMALHNAEVVDIGKRMYPVMYDFDGAGVIGVPYQTPDARLGLRTTKERLYRGLCVPMDTLTKAFDLFHGKREDIAKLYSDPLGMKIPRTRARDALDFFEDFYATIKDPRLVKREIVDKCADAR
jgi:hypothetical protein